MASIQVKKQLDFYIPLLSKQQQELVLDLIKNMLLIKEDDKNVSVKEYNKEIDESLNQINKGNFKTQKQVIRMIKK